jgi:hypothetical protein
VSWRGRSERKVSSFTVTRQSAVRTLWRARAEEESRLMNGEARREIFIWNLKSL